MKSRHLRTSATDTPSIALVTFFFLDARVFTGIFFSTPNKKYKKMNGAGTGFYPLIVLLLLSLILILVVEKNKSPILIAKYRHQRSGEKIVVRGISPAQEYLFIAIII